MTCFCFRCFLSKQWNCRNISLCLIFHITHYLRMKSFSIWYWIDLLETLYIYTNIIWTPLIKVSLIFSILIMTLVLCSYRGLECLNQKKIYNILKMMIYPNCFWQLILIGFWTIRGLNFHLLFLENMKGCFPFKKECLIIGCDILVLLREDDFDLSQPPKL